MKDSKEWNAMAVAGALALSIAVGASADFVPGQVISVNGAAGPQFGGTTFGSWADQGLHTLGSMSVYWDALFGSSESLTITVSSEFLAPGVLGVLVDFSEFVPGAFDTISVDLLALKSDTSIVGALASQGAIGQDGNNVYWTGFGGQLVDEPVLSITVFQIPEPSVVALLVLAGACSFRRRRG